MDPKGAMLLQPSTTVEGLSVTKKKQFLDLSLMLQH